MSSLASQMGYTFENNGVTVTLPPGTHFRGSLRNQAVACVNAARIEWVIDNGTLAIWPRGSSRSPLKTLASNS